MRLLLERRPWWGADRRGQSLVEFAIVFPVFMLLLGGVVQFGMLFWGQNTINQIVRDAGRYAASVTACDGSASADVVLRSESLGSGTILAGTVAVEDPVWAPSGDCPDTNAVDEAVWVRVRASGQVPVFFPFVPANGVVTSEAEYRVEPVLQ